MAESSTGIGMQGVPKKLFRRGELHQPALVLDAHAVAEVADHRQVVRDEQEREAMLPLQVLKEGHDLRLYGNVE